MTNMVANFNHACIFLVRVRRERREEGGRERVVSLPWPPPPMSVAVAFCEHAKIEMVPLDPFICDMSRVLATVPPLVCEYLNTLQQSSMATLILTPFFLMLHC